MRDDDFERLFEEHAGPLLGFLVYRTGDRAMAEDVLATAFERALRARGRFDRRKASEKTWLYAIALNCLRDEVRRQSAESRAVERAEVRVPPSDSEAWTEEVGDRDVVVKALEVLAPEEREALALRFGADLAVREIARVLKVSVTTAEGRVYRGLRKLREYADS